MAALRARLRGRVFDLLFVNAGVKNDDRETIADVATQEFVRVMVTNALSPMRVIEQLRDHVAPGGTIGVMSSGQGSVTNKVNGGYEVYRASKAALNTLMRSFAARHRDDQRSLLLMAPGWVRTDMGGPDARLSIADSIPSLVTTIEAQAGEAQAGEAQAGEAQAGEAQAGEAQAGEAQAGEVQAGKPGLQYLDYLGRVVPW